MLLGCKERSLSHVCCFLLHYSRCEKLIISWRGACWRNPVQQNYSQRWQMQNPFYKIKSKSTSVVNQLGCKKQLSWLTTEAWCNYSRGLKRKTWFIQDLRRTNPESTSSQADSFPNQSGPKPPGCGGENSKATNPQTLKKTYSAGLLSLYIYTYV